MNNWLMKSEPDTFSIDDLERVRVEPWNGVRNYQARNMIRDQMRAGALAFFYHSSCAIPAIAGVMEITGAAYPDPTAFDSSSPYYDPQSSPDKPRWYAIDVRFIRRLERLITLQELKNHPVLLELPLLQRGNRLSVMPVPIRQWEYILSLE
ncbi:MAG TPA: EVE domain-containing protein [Gammaproteobacteria bacterium]|nr:EVE domain-containing protein [Gammaproteobacteria bacterium]